MACTCAAQPAHRFSHGEVLQMEVTSTERAPGAPHWAVPLRSLWHRARLRRGEPPQYWLTRFVLLRLLGLVYLVAFLVLALQARPLMGANGLTPASAYLARIASYLGTSTDGFFRAPSVFWLTSTDAAMTIAAWTGVALSFLLLGGIANALSLVALWVLYLSFVHVGQLWYGYGWDIQLLETGFLAIFLVPL